MGEDTAWIVERADPKNPACVTGHFLGVAGSYDGVTGGGKLEWMRSVEYALRFARQKDAAMFIGMMEGLNDGIAHGNTLPGLRTGDARAIAVEHSWGMARAAESEAP